MTVNQLFVVGVLALQGAFREHIEFLHRAAGDIQGVQFEFIEVKTPSELSRCRGLVIPGGESTAMLLIAERTAMLEPLKEYCQEHPVWGTCAGLIFMSNTIIGAKVGQKLLGAMDIEVTRNAFGRQLDLFAEPIDFDFLQGGEFETVFIRAPVVTRVGKLTNILKLIQRGNSELVVAVRQGNKLGTSFHPELSDDHRFHKWFLTEFVLC